jgi:hypothetical protein
MPIAYQETGARVAFIRKSIFQKIVDKKVHFGRIEPRPLGQGSLKKANTRYARH